MRKTHFSFVRAIYSRYSEENQYWLCSDFQLALLGREGLGISINSYTPSKGPSDHRKSPEEINLQMFADSEIKFFHL